MNEPKHTPGPWSWEYHPDTHKPIALTAGKADVLLATGDEERSWASVGAANAQLIAAAPDLLDAARYCLDMLDQTYLGRTVADRLGLNGGLYAATKLRAAVARATGEVAR